MDITPLQVKVFYLPQALTLDTAETELSCLADAYPKLEKISGRVMRRYDSTFFVFVLELMRRLPSTRKQLVCEELDEALWALIRSYGLDTVLIHS